MVPSGDISDSHWRYQRFPVVLFGDKENHIDLIDLIDLWGPLATYSFRSIEQRLEQTRQSVR